MSKPEYKTALGRLDKDTRTCFKYLERLITEKFNSAMTSYQPPTPKADLREIESALDSLQKQFKGLRPKIEAGYKLSQDHDDQEKYLVEMADKVERVLEQYQIHFKELYASGYYKEGARRKIRKEGLIKNLKERHR